ncbi:MAG: tandem-95 repeat protein, partial [Deltaproteobacteria bacterium]|nr:tandem-95 repeat protein [Deltaproteobacteria bacterium]
VAISSFTQAQVNSGAVQFVHNGDEIAPSYAVSVSDGGYTDGPAAATIVFTNQNDAPNLVNNTLTISEGGSVVLSDANLMGSDVDTDDATLIFTAHNLTGGQFELVSNPGVAIGSFTQAQVDRGEVQFVHDGGEAPPSYEVSVSDGSLTDGPIAATINYNAVNQAPVAHDDNFRVMEDNTITITLATELLGNDTDRDGNSLSMSNFMQPSHGNLADNGDGTLTFTPDRNFNGTDSFTYTISDQDGGSATGTAIIVVTPVGDTPQVTDASARPGEQSGLIFIEQNANDGSEVTHFRISGITSGTLTLEDGVTEVHDGDYITVAQGRGGLRFTPAGNSTADGQFSVESSEDGVTAAGQSGVAISTITLLPPESHDSTPDPVESEDIDQTEDETVELVEDLEVIEEVVEDIEVLKETLETTDIQGNEEDTQTDETQEDSGVFDTTKDAPGTGDTITEQGDILKEGGDLTDNTHFTTKMRKILLTKEGLLKLKTSLENQGITTLTQAEYEFVRKSLEAFEEEIGTEIRLGKTVLGSAMATSVGLSAGYVLWMLKGGSLLASVLSSLPAWQLADPLAILTGTKDDDEDDDESLETILDEGAGQKPDRKDEDSDRDKKDSD